MTRDLFPYPRLFLRCVILQALGQQPGKVAGAVVIALGEMAVFRAGGLYAQVVHDDLLTGINADLILPAGSHRHFVDDNFHLLRRGCVGLIRAGHTLDAENLFPDALPAA